MLARNALVFGSIATALVAMACGSPPDIGKDGKNIGGSPNDPGWSPPGANNGPSPDNGNPQPGDDQGEQQPDAGNPSCTPPPTPALMEGWTTMSMHHFSFAERSDWITLSSFDDGSMPSEPKTFADVLVGKKLAVGNGWGVRVTEAIGAVADPVAEAKADFDAMIAKSPPASSNHQCISTISNAVIRCDPGALVTFDCTDPNGGASAHGTFMVVVHGGETFTVACNVEHQTDGVTVCDTVNGSFTVTM
jgi:hypothetical protein